MHHRDREADQCWSGYRSIGEAVRMSVNTVWKHITEQYKGRGLLRRPRPMDIAPLSGPSPRILPAVGDFPKFWQESARPGPLVARTRYGRRLAAQSLSSCNTASPIPPACRAPLPYPLSNERRRHGCTKSDMAFCIFSPLWAPCLTARLFF